MSTKHCLICKGGKKNECLHWHESEDGGLPWVWCQGVCQRAYSMYEYTALAGLSLGEYLTQKFEIREAPPNEVQKMLWPSNFIPLFDQRAKPAVEYLKSRGIDLDDGMYYDTFRKGIVFPYYYDQAFVGAQIRFIETWKDKDGTERKIDTLPGTRLGLVFYSWNSIFIPPQIKGIVITEGAFDCVCINQALNHIYGGMLKNPWKCIAASGSGASKHQIDTIRELKESGLRTVIAADSDEAGMKMFEKYVKAEAVTHFAFTEDSSNDWNSISRTMSKDEFARWFLGKVRHVGRS